MTRWLGLNLLINWFTRRFLGWTVRARVQPEQLQELNIDPDKPICYVLKNQSQSDYWLVDRECVNLGLPQPSRGLSFGNYSMRHAALFLSRQPWAWQRGAKHQPQELDNLLVELEAHPEMDLQLVPVSLFWGRAPERENSLFKILFADNWRVPGAFRKFLIILIQGRQTVVHFDEPVSARAMLAESADRELAFRKITRVFRTHFRRLKQAVIGPDLSHRRTLLNTLLQSPGVLRAIEEEAQRVPEKKRAKTVRKARKYAEEIAADYSHPVIRLYYICLTWLWNKLYNGVVATGFDRLRKVATRNEVIYVPCHRSHIDYLLMSYLLFHNDIVPPHIAAGVNLNMPVVGPILRRGGAFFLRRSFKGNPLYSAVFNEYLNLMFDRGFSVEYFIEGTRSRTGRLMAPRPGMLAMTVRSFLRTQRRSFVFVPVHVSYEKIIEASTYLGELYGKEKKKESIFDIFRTLRRIRGKFGQVYVNFGEPIPLIAVLDRVEPQWRTLPYEDEQPPQWLHQAVDSLGTQIITHINNAAVVNPVNLLSLVLLSAPNHALDEQTLTRHMDFALKFLRSCRYSALTEVTNLSGREILAYCEDMSILTRQKHPLGDIIRLNEQQALMLTYYRNNIIHLFALLSLVACLVLQNRRTERVSLYAQVAELYEFFRSELFLTWTGDAKVDEITRTYVDHLVESGYLVANTNEVWAPDPRSPEYLHLNLLANTTRHSLERFFMTVEILIKAGSGKLNAEQLEQLCTLLAQRMSLLHEFSGPEFSDKTVFRSFIATLVKNDVLQQNAEGALEFGSRLQQAYENTHSLLGAEISQSIQQIAELDIATDLALPTTETAKSKKQESRK